MQNFILLTTVKAIFISNDFELVLYRFNILDQVFGLFAFVRAEPPVSYGVPAAPVVETVPVSAPVYGPPAPVVQTIQPSYSGGYGGGSAAVSFEGGFGQGGGGGGGSGWGAPAPVIVEYGKVTHSTGPTQVRSYDYHSYKRIPSHEVKQFNHYSTKKKKIIHEHNQNEKVSHFFLNVGHS